MAKHKIAKTKREAGDTKVEAVEALPLGLKSLGKKDIDTTGSITVKAIIGPPTETKPAVQPKRDAKQDALNELASEVATIAQGRDAADIIWRFKLRNGGLGSTNLKFYSDCKKNEIENGSPCPYMEPDGSPVTLALSGPFGSPAKALKTGGCNKPGCK